MKYLFKGKNEGGHDFWMSYTDLMSGFLIVFIICSIIVYNKYSKKKHEYEVLCEKLHINPDSLMNQIDSIKYLSSLKNRISEYKDIFVETEEIKVVFDSKRGSIILTHKDPSKDLFAPGDTTIRSPLKEYLDSVYLDVVKKTIDLNTNHNIELRIEGHTDPTWGKEIPRGSDISFIKNLGLSSRRANAVYEYIFKGKKLNAEQRRFVERNMISVGYSFSERVQSDSINIDDASLDPASRRIEFRIISK